MWVLLLLPFIGLLWVPFYNRAEPSLLGFPFFYWYQLAWVPVTALLTWIVYRAGGHHEERDGRTQGDRPQPIQGDRPPIQGDRL